jgi:GAF domain-containing protein/tRNA A-37 threonylcarbamoyl transferase component Bud32
MDIERALKDSAERLRQLEALNEVARLVTDSGPLRPRLQSITDLLARRFDWEFVACASIDEAAGAFTCEAVTSAAPTEVRPGYGRPLGSGVVGEVAATGEALRLDDVRQHANYVETLAGVLSELCVPIKHGGRVIGVLNLESRRLAAFRDQQGVLHTVAEQIAGAMASARMYEQLVEAHRRLEAAQDKIQRLVESSPTAHEDVAGWSAGLAGEIAAAVGATALGVFELSDGAVLPLADGGLAAPPYDVARLAPRGGVVHQGDLLLPAMGAAGEPIGVLRVAGRRSGPSWSDRDQRLAVGFAHQLGGALEMRRLRAQLAAARAGGRSPVLVGTGAVLLDRYRIGRKLGEGGMGTVFEAHDRKLDRGVALKIIRPEHFHNPDMRLRFEREARSVARIRHPSVIDLYDSGELEDGSLFLVMERLRGHELSRVLREHGAGRPAQVAALARRGAAGLAAAHRAGIVHRDIKPANVFLVPCAARGDESPSGHGNRGTEAAGFGVKILDFGLAKAMGADVGLTRTGAMLGTPAYMAPEQVRGQPTDVRSDVYAFAAVVYEALTGRRAVGNLELARALVDVLDARVAPPSSIVATLPEGVDAAFAAALAKRIEDRPADVEAWAEELAGRLERCATEAAGWPPELAAGDEQPGGLGDPTSATHDSEPTLS